MLQKGCTEHCGCRKGEGVTDFLKEVRAEPSTKSGAEMQEGGQVGELTSQLRRSERRAGGRRVRTAGG